MLLIFDLDDTLIPTSREITPKKLELALKKMIDNGLDVSFEEGKEALLEMNERAKRSRDVIVDFVEKFQGTEVDKVVGLKALEGAVEGIEVTVEEGLNDFLKGLGKKHSLAIVTGGSDRVQQEKIDLYQIDRQLFKEILVAEWGGKGEAYKALKEKFGSFIVVGDRIGNDLCDAKKLGGITIHIRQGRGAYEPENHPDVDFTIGTIKELTKVLERV
jgi:FMN phosphatase YigB (HAD superfamily)